MAKKALSMLSKSQEAAATCVCFNLRKASRAVTQLYDGILQETGVRATQTPILIASYLAGEVTVSHLADTLVMDRTTLTRNLKPLEDQGLITVKTGNDRRTKAIALTSQGKAVLTRVLPLWEKAQKQIVGGLGNDRFKSLLAELSAAVSVARS
ncbi:MAG: MarR family winged helix-turn-helix transcriptional regulator [Gammaproteobacteria bacterium]|nr:MarR family winged helix-turn-helix transcriptional regulator [Gammaproteobacteria bacterium]